jgi:hypothetical protein
MNKNPFEGGWFTEEHLSLGACGEFSFRLARLIGRSEILLLGLTVVLQLVSLFTLLRVATGVAAETPTNSSQVIVIPKSLNQSVSVPISTPQFQNPVGSGFSASFVLVAVFVLANLIVISILAFLYRRKRMKWFSIVVSIFLIFNVTELYFSFIAGIYSVIPIIAAVVASVITIVSAVYGFSKLVNLLALFLALELGSSFPVLLQTPLNWIIPAVYSVFDIYAIYYGRLGKLVKQVGQGEKTEKVKEQPTPEKTPEITSKSRLRKWPDFGLLTVSFGGIEIGMADIAFYTMVPTIALILVSPIAFIVVMAVLDVGLILSFYLFRNKEVAPGLPVPILLGLAALLVMYLLK